MKQFQWRLQSVLDIREKQQQLRRAELAELAATLRQRRQQRRHQKQIVADLMDSLAAESPQARWKKQALVMAHAKANDERIREIEQAIETLETDHQAKLDEVLALKKQIEGLARLRAKALLEFVTEQDKQQQQAADEMTTYRYAKQRLTGTPVETAER